MQTRSKAVFLAAIAVIGGIMSKTAKADVTLPALISEGMILQQKTPVRIYGTATPEEKVTVEIQGKKQTATANGKGNWEVILRPLAAGGPFTLTIEGKNKIEFKDVLVGEIWVCSGQSNMEYGMGGLPEEDAKSDVAASADPLLRMFTVTKKISGTPLDDVFGKWESASPQNTPGFSAVGYYFARALRAERKVPIGMIHTSWGGTRIEAWTAQSVLLANGTPASEFALSDPKSQLYKDTMARYNRAGRAVEGGGVACGRLAGSRPARDREGVGSRRLPRQRLDADYRSRRLGKFRRPGVGSLRWRGLVSQNGHRSRRACRKTDDPEPRSD